MSGSCHKGVFIELSTLFELLRVYQGRMLVIVSPNFRLGKTILTQLGVLSMCAANASLREFQGWLDTMLRVSRTITNTFLNLRERQALIDILRGTDVRERAKKINLSVSRVYCMRVDVCRKFGVNSAHALRSILIKELKR